MRDRGGNASVNEPASECQAILAGKFVISTYPAAFPQLPEAIILISDVFMYFPDIII